MCSQTIIVSPPPSLLSDQLATSRNNRQLTLSHMEDMWCKPAKLYYHTWRENEMLYTLPLPSSSIWQIEQAIATI